MISKYELIEKYKELVVKQKSSKINVKDLCNELGISRTTFYKNFKDIYEIIEYILVNESIKLMNTLIIENIDPFTIVESWYVSFYKNKDFYYYAIKDEAQNSLFNTLINKLTEFNKELYGNIYSGDDLEYLSYKNASMQAMLLKKWIIEGMVIEPKKMTEYYMNSFK